MHEVHTGIVGSRTEAEQKPFLRERDHILFHPHMVHEMLLFAQLREEVADFEVTARPDPVLQHHGARDGDVARVVRVDVNPRSATRALAGCNEFRIAHFPIRDVVRRCVFQESKEFVARGETAGHDAAVVWQWDRAHAAAGGCFVYAKHMLLVLLVQLCTERQRSGLGG